MNILVPKVDVYLLRHQRDRLLMLQEKRAAKNYKGTLEGVINLLDAMLDIAEVK